MATRNGVIKKTALSQFKHLRNLGLKAIVMDDGDDLIGAELADGASEIILSSAKGMACRFLETDVRCLGRSARGVTGIKFKIEGDEVVSMEVVPASAESLKAIANAPAEGAEEAEEAEEVNVPEIPETEEETASDSAEEEIQEEDDGRPQLLVITSGGMGKRSYVENYRLTKRAAMGVRNLDLKDGESVVAALRVHTSDELILTTERGLISRIMVKEIRLVGRLSKGVRIMDLRKNDRITGANVVVEVDAPETPAMKEEDMVIAAAGVPVKKEVSEEVTDVPEIPENGEEGSSSTEE
jgi:DNA gyrase subunit A